MKSRAVAHVLDKCHISARLKLPSHSDRLHRGEAEGKLPLYQPVQTTRGSFFQKSSSIANTGLTNQQAIEAELKSNLQAPNSETNPPPPNGGRLTQQTPPGKDVPVYSCHQLTLRARF